MGSDLGFQRDGTVQFFGIKGQKFLHCPGTKGQAKNIAKGRDRPGQPKFGTGQAGTAKIPDRTREKTGQSRKGRSKTGK